MVCYINIFRSGLVRSSLPRASKMLQDTARPPRHPKLSHKCVHKSCLHDQLWAALHKLRKQPSRSPVHPEGDSRGCLKISKCRSAQISSNRASDPPKNMYDLRNRCWSEICKRSNENAVPLTVSSAKPNRENVWLKEVG
jgi:hypothetical protein